MSDQNAALMRDKFVFVNDHHTKEPYMFDVLNEMQSIQQSFLSGASETLATAEIITESRSLKIPVSPSRPRTVSYIIELLLKNYPNVVKTVLSFDFKADPATKSLEIIEKRELTVLLPGDKVKGIQERRDKDSVQNILKLFSEFRLFNLTKLLKRAVNRQYLAGLIKSELGKNLFTYKTFLIDKHGMESAEDICFHRHNYESVKNGIDIEFMKNLVSSNSSLIAKYLKKYGLLNADFSDYRDSKIDYIISIIIDYLSSDINQKEMTTLKNFKALRECVLKVDKVLDPLETKGADILGFIRDNFMASTDEVSSAMGDISREDLRRWIEDNCIKNKIATALINEDEKIFITGDFLKKMADLKNQILYSPELFQRLTYADRTARIDTFEDICAAGEYLVQNRNRFSAVLTDVDVAAIEQTLKEYSDSRKKTAAREEMLKGSQQAVQQGPSFFEKIVGIIKSIFGGNRSSLKDSPSQKSAGMSITFLTPETKSVFEKIKERSAKVIALSEFLDLDIANNSSVDTIINELRRTNLKVVIPVFNSRKNLFPQRSKNLMMADVEYLLIDPSHTKHPDTIREFTDTLTGYKIRDEVIPGTAIVTIEKYLLTIYRQKRARKG